MNIEVFACDIFTFEIILITRRTEYQNFLFIFFRGRWHGDIMIHTRRRSTREDVEEFLKEVSVLSMIRHENVVLFMGACLEPPNLAVITRYTPCFFASFSAMYLFEVSSLF